MQRLTVRHVIISLALLLLAPTLFVPGRAQEQKRAADVLLPVRLGGKWGYINGAGSVVVAPQFAFASKFSEGLSKVRVGEKWGDGKWGYIDKTGRMVIKPELEDVPSDAGDCDSFSEGLACISVQEKVGYIDKSGRVVIQPQFDLASSFSNGIASVALGKYSTDNPESDLVSSGDMWGYIDKTGKYIWKPTK